MFTVCVSTTFLLIFLISSLIFVSQTHPFFVSLTLVVLSINVIFIFSSFSEHWLNFVFVLIYLGGVLVIFVYTSSILPNFNFDFHSFYWGWFLPLFIIFIPVINLESSFFEKGHQILLNMTTSQWLPLWLFFSFLFLTLVVTVEFSWQKSSPMKGV